MRLSRMKSHLQTRVTGIIQCTSRYIYICIYIYKARDASRELTFFSSMHMDSVVVVVFFFFLLFCLIEWKRSGNEYSERGTIGEFANAWWRSISFDEIRKRQFDYTIDQRMEKLERLIVGSPILAFLPPRFFSLSLSLQFFSFDEASEDGLRDLARANSFISDNRAPEKNL